MKPILTFLLLLSLTASVGGSDLKTREAVTETRLHDFEQRMDTIFELHNRAQGAAEEAIKKRLEAMNEVRAQLKYKAATFLTRSEYLTAHEDLIKQPQDVKLYQANQEGRLWMLGAGLTLFFSVAQVVSYFLVKKHHAPT